MGNRIIRESFCESEKISALTDFDFRLWVTLIVLADDYGRGQANPALIRGRGYPLRDGVSYANIKDALVRLASRGCIDLYTVDGKDYYAFPNWSKHQKIRAKKPRFPGPDGTLPQLPEGMSASANICGQMSADVPVIQSNPNTNTNPNPSARADDYLRRHYTDAEYRAMVTDLDREPEGGKP